MRTRESNSDPRYVTPATRYGKSAQRTVAGQDYFGAPNAETAQGTFPGSPVVIDYSTSKIIDEVSPSRITKPVTHTRERTVRYDFPDVWEYVSGGSGNKNWYRCPYAHNYSWGWYSGDSLIVYPKVSLSWPKTVNQLASQAMSSFRSVNKVDNLLNVVESSQLKASSGDVFETLRKIAGQRTSQGALREAKRASKRWSSFYLFYSFGIAPLLADIRKINRAVVTLHDDLEKMIRNYNKPVMVTAQCTGSLQKNPSYTKSGYSGNGGSGYWDFSIQQNGPVKRLVGVKGRRNVDYNSDAFKKLHYVISRFVATGPASFAWERIPFSFVVDWFLDLSGIIDSLDNALTGFSQSVDDIWYSEKYSYILPHRHTASKYQNYVTSTEGQVTMQQELSYYHRSHYVPTIMPVGSDRFGKKQASLLAALLHQYVAKLGRLK